MNRHSHNNCSLPRLLAGWCGLLLYVGAYSPFGMCVLALLGTIDPDHHAIFQQGTEGMRLVLHHEGNCSVHQHGVVARALTIFAQSANNTDPDHVLHISSVDSLTRASQLVLPAANESAPVPVVFTEPDVRVVAKTNLFISPPRPPPDIVRNLLRSRSTVLLI